MKDCASYAYQNGYEFFNFCDGGSCSAPDNVSIDCDGPVNWFSEENPGCGFYQNVPLNSAPTEINVNIELLNDLTNC
jgi:hypothetical protein